ncbi:MAG: InlB B-repeat-containing protein, partial [Candidatus Ornithomonoglobus sp.]
MKKFIITLLALSTITASMIPAMADNNEPAETVKDAAVEKTAEPKATDEAQNAAESADGTPKPDNEDDPQTDLSGDAYDIGAPLLNASIKQEGDSYVLTLSTLGSFVIYYTEDGSAPLPGEANTSKYTEPVKLSTGSDKDGGVDPAELRIVVVDPDGSMDGAVASSYFSNIDKEPVATPEPDKFTASFWSDGGSAVETQTVYVGEKLTEPEDVLKNGYTFQGWFKDELFT